MDIRKTRTELSRDLRRLTLRLGWLGALAAVLLALAAIELSTETLPVLGEANELQERVRRVRESPRNRREIMRTRDSGPAEQVSAFERFFPEASELNRVLREIHAAAEKEKLVLERGEYKFSEEAGLGMLRYQITLPVKGTYPSIRAFMRRGLKDIPSVALDSVVLQRPNVGDEAIEAQIRFSAFYRGAR